MARHPEMSLTYFPHTIQEGEKLERISAKFGHTGKWLWFEMLERIYGKKGYYMPYSEDDMEFITDKYGAPFDICRAALAMMIDREMFSKSLFEKHSILTSESIQKQFIFAKDPRSILMLNPAFWLLNLTETITTRNVRWISINAGSSGINAEDRDINAEDRAFLSEKCHKVNKSKLNKIKGDIYTPREELLEEPKAEPESPLWLRQRDPISRLLAHLEATRPDETLPNGALRAKSSGVERGWVALFFQSYGEEKVHAAFEAVHSEGWHCTRKHVEFYLKHQTLAGLYPDRTQLSGGRSPASFGRTATPKQEPGYHTSDKIPAI
ncbi:MAG TPA: DUF4373 domain-containing protein [Candidatus Kapabacteria bacterium]